MKILKELDDANVEGAHWWSYYQKWIPQENYYYATQHTGFKANPERSARGAVIEAKLDIGRGPVATVLVQKGTLNKGDIFVVGEQWGKVRALINDKGEKIENASPSVPVEVFLVHQKPKITQRDRY